jgi:hypothetical protein
LRVCRYKDRSISRRNSIFALSLFFNRGRHSCRKIDVLKKQSAGCEGSLCSMVIFFRVIQRAQLWAANNIQITDLKLMERELTIPKKSWKEWGFHCTPRASLVPLQANTTRKTAIGGRLTRSAYSKWCAAAI